MGDEDIPYLPAEAETVEPIELEYVMAMRASLVERFRTGQQTARELRIETPKGTLVGFVRSAEFDSDSGRLILQAGIKEWHGALKGLKYASQGQGDRFFGCHFSRPFHCWTKVKRRKNAA